MDLFEYNDILNSPVEAFYCSDSSFQLPVRLHWHYFVEMLYVEEGCINVSFNNLTFTLNEGEMIIIPPQTVHSVFQDTPSHYNYVCIKFNARRIQFMDSYIPDASSLLSYIAQLSNPHCIFNDSDFEGNLLRNFFDRMVSEVNHKEYGFYTFIYNSITSLFLQMIRIWYKSGIDFNHDEIISRDGSPLHEALLYIDRHSNENISIDHLAKLSNMSYSYFAKQFHAKYGQSCKQYIEFIRLIKAENLLLFTDYDLSYIASETGFSDCSHLIRCFKRKYNTTPKQFRISHGL